MRESRAVSCSRLCVTWTRKEGIVAKKKDPPYCSDGNGTTWIKIKNPRYSQIQGRHELFAAG